MFQSETPVMVDTFREVALEYASELLDLTFNSKPIINNLTIIAGENIPAGSEIVRIIEDRILKADLEKKLPVLYLLDSIIKNIGGVYLTLFAENIVPVFCAAFEASDMSTRMAMQHLLKTWVGVFPQEKIDEMQDRIKPHMPAYNNPQPHGIHVNPKYLNRPREGFPEGDRWRGDPRTQRRGGPPINVGRGPRDGMGPRDVPYPEHGHRYGDERAHPYRRASPPNRPYAAPNDYSDNSRFPPPHEQLMQQELLIQQTNTVIQQIQQQIQAGNRQQNQQQLLELLQTFLKQQHSSQMNPQAKDNTYMTLLPLLQQYQQQQQGAQLQNQGTSSSLFQTSQRGQLGGIYSNMGFPSNNNTPMLNSQMIPNMMNTGPNFINNPNMMNMNPMLNANTTSLIDTLTSLGFINNNITIPVNPALANNKLIPGVNPMLPVVTVAAPVAVPASRSLLPLPTPVAPAPKGTAVPGFVPATIPASSTPGIIDLKRTDRSVINTLYTDFTLQCKTCGLRFNDSDRMGKHLDWHFNTNRKEKMRSKQAVSRPWFLTPEDWVDFKGSEIFEQPSAPFFEEKVDEVDIHGEVPVSSVVADETQANCPVCHEVFDQFWDTEQEEWMYRASVLNPADYKITHQKCLSNMGNENGNQSSKGDTPSPPPMEVKEEVPFFQGIDDLSY